RARSTRPNPEVRLQYVVGEHQHHLPVPVAHVPVQARARDAQLLGDRLQDDPVGTEPARRRQQLVACEARRSPAPLHAGNRDITSEENRLRWSVYSARESPGSMIARLVTPMPTSSSTSSTIRSAFHVS